MFRRIVTIVIVVPLAAVIIAFAVANRQMVTVSFDPFNAASPAYAATVPLFLLIFALVILGVIVGGVASWLRQGSWRRAARKLDAENRVLNQELASLRHRLSIEAQGASAAVPGRNAAPAPPSLPTIPPPAA